MRARHRGLDRYICARTIASPTSACAGRVRRSHLADHCHAIPAAGARRPLSLVLEQHLREHFVDPLVGSDASATLRASPVTIATCTPSAAARRRLPVTRPTSTSSASAPATAPYASGRAPSRPAHAPARRARCRRRDLDPPFAQPPWADHLDLDAVNDPTDAAPGSGRERRHRRQGDRLASARDDRTRERMLRSLDGARDLSIAGSLPSATRFR